MVTSTPSHSPATEADLDFLPEQVMGQIIGGELVVHPRPGAPHTEAASMLGALLIQAFGRGNGGPGGWVILHEPDIRFGRDLLVPDLAGWRRERFVSPEKGPYVVTPDWTCELLSPSSVRDDRVRKLPIYARHGVGHAWILDPDLRTFEVLRLHQGAWLIVGLHESADRVRAEPFEAIELDLTLLWREAPAGRRPPAADTISEPAAEYNPGG
ncbi:MAG TPA: Uma2 family endonuclease [Thermoanaerobaculia bacterium]|nr:Uma2 family endonuclease [Thermoanaerobaculia bacterium]